MLDISKALSGLPLPPSSNRSGIRFTEGFFPTPESSRHASDALLNEYAIVQH